MKRRCEFLPLGRSMAPILIVASLAFACDRGSPPAGGRVQHGQAIYARACATCHGREGEGMPMFGKGLRGNVFMRDLNDAQLVDFIKEGRPSNHELNTTGIDMPPRGGDPSLDDQDLLDLVAYLRTLDQP